MVVLWRVTVPSPPTRGGQVLLQRRQGTRSSASVTGKDAGQTPLELQQSKFRIKPWDPQKNENTVRGERKMTDSMA